MRALFAVLLLTLTGGAQAGEPLRPGRDLLSASRPPMRFFGEREGLPHHSVYTLTEDRQGRLWATTQDGAARYNGRSWVALNLPPERLTNFVRTLTETPDGAFWFATETGGLWRLHHGKWSHFGRAEGLPSDRINALHVMERPGGSYVLFAGTSQGIGQFQGGAWTHAQGTPWTWSFSLVHDPSGRERFLAATLDGPWVLEQDGWKPFRGIPGLDHQEINAIREAVQPGGRREWWIGAWGKGLARWDGTRLAMFDPTNGFPSRFPVALCTTQDKEGHPIIWAGTYDSGLAWITRGTIRVLNTDRGLPSDGVYSVFAPRSGRPTIWVGFRGGGLGNLDLSGWQGLDRQMGLPADEVRAFAETIGPKGESVPWLATSRGIAHFEGGQWHIEGLAAGLPSDRIESLCVGTDGTSLWAGTQGGLARREGGRWHPVPLALPLKDKRVLNLLATRDDQGREVLWAGTEGGLVRRDADGARLYTTADGLPSNLVYSLLETRDSSQVPTLWVGTRGGGIASLRQGRWRAYGAKDGLLNLGIYALQEQRTPDGRRWVWAGTFGGGVARLSLEHPDGPWEVFTTRNLPGLPSDTVVRIEAPRQDQLYLATQRGVARLSFDPAGHPSKVEVFSLGDGLPPVSTSYGASMVDRKGRIWVATYHGAALFDPALELPPPPLADLRLDGVQAAGRYRTEPEGLNFRYTDRPLLFEYSLTSHYRDEETRYRTQLLGEEREPGPWTPEGRRELTALSGGRYTLRVWAQDYLGRISGPLDLPLRIHPPPWASPWAYLVYVLAAAGLLLLAYRLRTRLLQERNRLLQARIHEATATLEAQRRELERMNEDKNRFMGLAAHDLRSPLNSIVLSAEALLDGPSEVTDYGRCVHRIKRAATQMDELIGNLVQTNQIESGFLALMPALYDLRTLAADAHQRFLDQARAKGQRLEFSTPWEDIPIWVDSSYLHQVLDNLLSNAIKFTPPGPPARRINLRVARQGAQAVIEVQDEGPGLSPEDLTKVFGRFARLSARPTGGEGSTGLGLSIVKSLVEGMKGWVSVESELGNGATFRVVFPLAEPTSAPPDRQEV